MVNITITAYGHKPIDCKLSPLTGTDILLRRVVDPNGEDRQAVMMRLCGGQLEELSTVNMPADITIFCGYDGNPITHSLQVDQITVHPDVWNPSGGEVAFLIEGGPYHG